MGSRGAMLESGGFRTPAGWHTVSFIHGVKVLLPNKSGRSRNLPQASNTPGTKYLLLNPDKTFRALRIFGKNRLAEMDIDYHKIDGKMQLHKHLYNAKGERQKEHLLLSKEELKKYRPYLKGVPLP